jgi:uncharacterized YigZ family protein
MTKQYVIPAKEARTWIEIQKSKFITSAGPAFSVEQAKAFIDRIREEFPDATHNVPVFIIGREPNSIEHCSDDGEPSGTAGRPALAVLKGSGLGDVVLVVTRYFGGTKLGTGGLVRAYGDAVRAVLEVLPRAKKIATYLTEFSISYSLYERVKILILSYGGIIDNEEFSADVTISARFPTDRFDQFKAELLSLTNGAITAEIMATDENTILPIGD